jgi:hypothetical protein
MDHGSLVQKIFASKSEGRRRMGNPRLRRLEDVEKDLHEMKVKRWRRKAVYRVERGVDN